MAGFTFSQVLIFLKTSMSFRRIQAGYAVENLRFPSMNPECQIVTAKHSQQSWRISCPPTREYWQPGNGGNRVIDSRAGCTSEKTVPTTGDEHGDRSLRRSLGACFQTSASRQSPPTSAYRTARTTHETTAGLLDLGDGIDRDLAAISSFCHGSPSLVR